MKFKVPRHSLRTIAFLLFDHIGGVNTLLYTLSNAGCVITVSDRTPEKVLNLIEILINVKEIKGDIVECGSYKGGTGILIALALDHFGINKNVYLLYSGF